MAKSFSRYKTGGTSQHVEGLDKINAALLALGEKAGKAALYKGLEAVAEPVRDTAKALVPVDQGNLRDAIDIGKRLTDKQRKISYGIKAARVKEALGLDRKKRLSREQSKNINDTAELYVGVSQVKGEKEDPNQYAHLVEFGSYINEPSGFMRAAWDEHKGSAVDTFAATMKKELGL